MIFQQTICPCCGYDLVADAPIVINDFSMHGAGYPLLYQGCDAGLTPHQNLICWTLMKSYPKPVKKGVLIERLDADTEDPDALANTYISKIRSNLKKIGAPPSIVTMGRSHASYLWDPRGGEHAKDEEGG